MSKKHTFIGSFINVLKHNKDGSYRTQDDRRKMLNQTAKTLWSMGYKLDSAKYIRTRHIYKLVEHWKANGDSPGTLRNKMASLRWLMEKFNKSQVVPNNTKLNLPKRQYVTNHDKSRLLTEAELESISKPHRKMSLRAQSLFGLRVEESLKIQPHIADQGDQLYLKGSWTKGGRKRFVPILTQEQRDWVNEAKALVKHKGNSLIPQNTTYKTYRNTINQYFRRKGICRTHGLRHQYAQQRYKALAGWKCPVKGGLEKLDMTLEQQQINRAVRQKISENLGHSRARITNIYLGKLNLSHPV